MEKDRLVAFSDGVIAIIITIMELELKVPTIEISRECLSSRIYLLNFAEQQSFSD